MIASEGSEFPSGRGSVGRDKEITELCGSRELLLLRVRKGVREVLDLS